MRRATLLFLQTTACVLACAVTTGTWASEQATVNSDALAVHSGNSSTSKIVKQLAKGDVVLVEMEVTGREGAWCNIREKDQTRSLGFVPCKELARQPRPQPPQWASVPQPESVPMTGEASQGQSATGPKPSASVQNFEAFRAVVRGDFATVKTLLRSGADPNLFLYAASEDGKIEMVQFFLENGADVNAINNFNGATPLIGAALRGKVETVQFLLAHGADVNKRIASGSTATRLTKQMMEVADQMFLPSLNTPKEHKQKFREIYFSRLRQIIAILEQAGGTE
jgi:hypothetical protein